MHKEILIDSSRGDVRIAVKENGKLVELFFESVEQKLTAGDIYKGEVEAVLPGLQSAFVDIGYERRGYLHRDDIIPISGFEDIAEMLGGGDFEPTYSRRKYDIQDLIRVGQEVIVQVHRESIGEKGAKLTTNISIPDRYLVLMPFQDKVHISRRIDDSDTQKRLINLVHQIKPDNAGFIIRTAAENVDEKALQDNMNYVLSLWDRIKKRARRQRGCGVLYEEKGLLERILRDIFNENIDLLIVDSIEIYDRVQQLTGVLTPGLFSRVRLYEDQMPLFETFGIETEIEKMFRRKIWLRSGGYIVIDQTEALVAIDVNTGRFLGKEDQETTIFKTNLEASDEIARQVRLRNIGGLIIIDFIDMNIADHREEILNRLRSNMSHDGARSTILELSALGMVEMTRQRTRDSITSILTDICPLCRGKGSVFTNEAMGDKIELEIRRTFGSRTDRDLLIVVNPRVKQFIDEFLSDRLNELERDFQASIMVEGRLGIPFDDIEIHTVPGTRYINN